MSRQIMSEIQNRQKFYAEAYFGNFIGGVRLAMETVDIFWGLFSQAFDGSRYNVNMNDFHSKSHSFHCFIISFDEKYDSDSKVWAISHLIVTKKWLSE